MSLSDVTPMYVRSTGRTAGSKYPLPPSGYNSDLKRQWAQKHLETVKSHIERFCNDYPYEITGEENIEAGIILLKTIHPPILKAVDASLAFGDFISCLRSSLDHLAWQLASLSGKRPGREVFFPIYEQNTIDVQVKIARATFGIPDEAIALIKSFQLTTQEETTSPLIFGVSIRAGASISIDISRHFPR
jgi:hypothetical protein